MPGQGPYRVCVEFGDYHQAEEFAEIISNENGGIETIVRDAEGNPMYVASDHDYD